MRNFEQMAENVLRRRDQYVIRQKQVRKYIGTGMAMVLICLIGVLSIDTLKTENMEPTEPMLYNSTPMQQTVHETENTVLPSTQGTVQTEKQNDEAESGIVFVAYNADAVEEEFRENVEFPLCCYMGVTDIRDLKTEAEVVALMNQQSAAMDAYMDKLVKNADIYSSNIAGAGHHRTLRRENYVISTLHAGSIQVCFDDFSSVETIQINTTSGYGEVIVYQWYTEDDTPTYLRGLASLPASVDVDAYFPEGHENRLLIDWWYSTKLLEELEEDPTVPLTNYSDVIVITVTNKDGTQYSYSIDIFIKNDGAVCAVLHGNGNNF